MDLTLMPCHLRGNLSAIPSKSQAHRLLICGAFANAPTKLICPDTNEDIEATADCLRALGCEITREEDGYTVIPMKKCPKTADLYCRESGSTLRFLLPIAGALGVNATFHMEGRLPQRPLSPLWEEMERMDCHLSHSTENTLCCTGKLKSGSYYIDGGVSSQFITGLLFALSLMEEESSLEITGNIESLPYIQMTQDCLGLFGVNWEILGKQTFRSPGAITVEGDWSNAAFFLAANALGHDVRLSNLNPLSPQGDREIIKLLPLLESGCPTIDAANIPDLVPILAVVAGAKHGAIFTHIGRLRLKETDRVATVCAMLHALGASTQVTQQTLQVFPGSYHSCTIDASGDHRIAMSAAIAAAIASGPVTVLGADAVKKSYPKFWEDYRQLGGTL